MLEIFVLFAFRKARSFSLIGIKLLEDEQGREGSRSRRGKHLLQMVAAHSRASRPHTAEPGARPHAAEPGARTQQSQAAARTQQSHTYLQLESQAYKGVRTVSFGVHQDLGFLFRVTKIQRNTDCDIIFYFFSIKLFHQIMI